MSWWSSRSTPPSPQVVVETASKRARTDAASPSSPAAFETSNSFAALADREPEPRPDLSLEGSQHAPAKDAPTATSAPTPPSKPSTYAQATRGDPQPSRKNKRKGGSAPSGMPDKERGSAWFKHPQLESFLRPAPKNTQANVLWLDLKSLGPANDFTPAEALKMAMETIGDDAVGFVTAGGMRSLGIVFPSSELRAKYDGTTLNSGLRFYQALSPSQQQPVRRLTLQGVPVEAKDRTIAALKTAFGTTVELLEVVPLVPKGYSHQWASDTFHVTIGTTLDPEDIPETITLLEATVLVHIPGVRRICPHCQHAEHTEDDCRTAQRQKQQQQRQQQPPPPQPQPPQRKQQLRSSKPAADKPAADKPAADKPSRPRSSSRADKSWEDQTEAEIEEDTMSGVEETVLDHDNEDLTADGHRADFDSVWNDDVDENSDIILHDRNGDIIYNDDDDDKDAGSETVTPTTGSSATPTPNKRVTRSHKA